MTRFTRWLRRVLRLPCRHEWGAPEPATEVWEMWAKSGVVRWARDVTRRSCLHCCATRVEAVQ